ncbi:hypothetical protein BJF88_06375 [Cellulosimicrobium sp. CUA-896]|nr:hypothetical protein BJF88_06375 [Cellulosimicrobium sp. CUA-896]
MADPLHDALGERVRLDHDLGRQGIGGRRPCLVDLQSRVGQESHDTVESQEPHVGLVQEPRGRVPPRPLEEREAQRAVRDVGNGHDHLAVVREQPDRLPQRP